MPPGTGVPRGPRRRLDPVARREQLVALGLELLRDHPIDHQFLDRVIVAAGISKGLLFHYFPTKRDFQAAVVEAATAQLLDSISGDPHRDPDTRLRQGIAAYVAWIEQNEAGYLAFARGAGSDPALLDLFESTRDTVVALLVDGLVGAGVAADAPTLRLAARGWIASVEETTFLWLRDRPCSREELLALLFRQAAAIPATSPPAGP
jgi:AcrR family transcriptional regulator